MSTRLPEDLWCRLLAGETLDPADERELREALAADAALRTALLRDDHLHGILRALGADCEGDAADFVSQFLGRLDAERDAGRFIGSVQRGIADDSRANRLRRLLAALGLTAAVAAVLVLIGFALRPESSPSGNETTSRSVPRPDLQPGETRGRGPRTTGPVTEKAMASAAAGSVLAAKGDAVALRAGRPIPLQPHAPLAVGDDVRTGEKGSLTLRLRDGATLSLEPSTTVRMGSERGEAPTQIVQVLGGGVKAEADAQQASRALVLATPHARMVVSTAATLALTVDPKRTLLEVEDGQVELITAGDADHRIVGAGQQALALAEPEATGMSGRAGGAARALPLPHLVDFENGEGGMSPGTLTFGHVEPGPARPGNSLSALGTVNPWEPARTAVRIDFAPRDAIRVTPGLVVAFDYWVGRGGDRIVLQVWSPSPKQTYRERLKGEVATETWAHARFQIANLRSNGRATGGVRMPLQEGAYIRTITVMGGQTGGAPFFVDNLKILNTTGGD